MGRPWGLSGPDFLLLYAMVLLMICLAFFAARWWAKGTDRGVGEAVPDLDVYDFAYLNGGPERVAETAVAALVESGALRPSRRRQLTTTGRSGVDDYQSEVLDRVQSGSTVANVRKSLRNSESVRTLASRLRDRGLLVPAGRQRVVTGAVLLCPVLGAVGVARFVNGAAQGYPVGFLAVELVVTLFAWVLLNHKAGAPNRTRAGDRAVGEGPEDSASAKRLIRARLASGGAAASLVASGGISDYPDPMVARLLVPAPSSGGGGGTFGGSGGGCGGGGGGCGGGGC
jgi:uncharacterized protein (TIGR04222 family)